MDDNYYKTKCDSLIRLFVEWWFSDQDNADYFNCAVNDVPELGDAIVKAIYKLDGLCPDCGRDYFENETIVNGELRCSCAS